MEFAPKFQIPDKNIKSTSLLAVGMSEGGIKIWNTETGNFMFKKEYCYYNILILARGYCGAVAF